MSMVDVANAIAAPPGAAAYAGYADGAWRSYATLVARFPQAKHLEVTIAADSAMLGYDCESGNAGPGPVAASARARLNQRLPSVIYTNTAWYPAMTAALKAQGMGWMNPASWPAPGAYWWHADPTGVQHLSPGSIATQWLWVAYDLSEIYGNVFPSLTLPALPASTPAPAPLAPLAGVAAIAGFARPQGDGYWIAHADGRTTAHGGAKVSCPTQKLNQPVMGGFSTLSGNGFYLVAADGGVFTFGDAEYKGGLGGQALNARIVGGAVCSAGGYWLVGQDGGVFSFGGAPFEGSEGAAHLNAPIVGMSAHPDGKGYWLVAHDGGIFSFGDAPFDGSLGGTTLNAPVMNMAATVDGGGYWMVAADGGVFTEGDAVFNGSHGGAPVNAPVVDIARTASGKGYWLFAADGGVFSYGDAVFYGSDA